MLIVVRPRAGPAGTLMTRPCRRIRFAVHHDANVHLAPREGRSSGWRPRTLLAARLHRRRLGLRCSRCLRHLMLAVHSTQRTPRLLPDSSHNGQRRVGAATGPGAVLATFATADLWPYWITYANTAPVLLGYLTRRHARSQPKKHSRPNDQRGLARGLDSTPVCLVPVRCVFIPVTISK